MWENDLHPEGVRYWGRQLFTDFKLVESALGAILIQEIIKLRQSPARFKFNHPPMICRVKPQTDRLGMYVSTGRRHSVPEIELPENIEWIDDDVRRRTRQPCRLNDPFTNSHQQQTDRVAVDPKGRKKGNPRLRSTSADTFSEWINSSSSRQVSRSVVISVMCEGIQFSCPQVDLWLMNLLVVGHLISHVLVSNARGKPYTYRFQNRILLSIHLIFIHSNDVRFPLLLDCVIRFSG